MNFTEEIQKHGTKNTNQLPHPLSQFFVAFIRGAGKLVREVATKKMIIFFLILKNAFVKKCS